MTQHSHTGPTRRDRSQRRLLAVVFLAFAVGAGIAPRPVDAAPSPLNAQPQDHDQRNRQFQHAEALYLSGRLKEAAAAFEELSRIYPNDARVWLKYGNTLTKQGSYDNAAAAFQNASALDPEQGAAALNLALVRLAQAQAALDAAVARLPADSSEHAQADGLQRQIKLLLGTSDRGTSSH